MMTSQQKEGTLSNIEMPRRMSKLPIDPVWKLPVPWFVAWVDGKPCFPVMDAHKWNNAVRYKLCWICGQALRDPMAFVIGPMCGINRTSAEPPSHVTCAMYAAQACPFLTTPKMKRMDVSHLDAVDAPGIALQRNPGCCAVWITNRYTVFEAGNGRLIDIGEPRLVHWFASGRKATREEVMESINSGLPSLQEIATAEGPEAEAELVKMTKAFERLLPV